MITIAQNLHQAEFISRPNRFIANILINGKEEVAHVPNPGRMNKFLLPHVKLLVEKNNNPNRKTQFSVKYVLKNDILILIDSIITNRIFFDALKRKIIPQFRNVQKIKPEQPYGAGNSSRIDFLLDDRIYIEIKSANYQEDGIGYWPDAPSLRGQKHVKELIQEINKNPKHEAWIIFLSQREDITQIEPFDEIDPNFGKIFRDAMNEGVKTTAFGIKFLDGGKKAELGKELPVRF